MTEQEKIEQAAKEKYPYVWPKNKHGEDIVMRVGQKAPPNSAKIRKLQQSFISGASFYAKEVMPGELEKFSEWLRTFEALERQNGQWVIESQLSDKDIVKAFIEDTEQKEG